MINLGYIKDKILSSFDLINNKQRDFITIEKVLFVMLFKINFNYKIFIK